MRQINHIDVWYGDGAITAYATGEDVFNGTDKGTNYGNRDICEAKFNAENVVSTAIENRPYSILALPLIAY